MFGSPQSRERTIFIVVASTVSFFNQIAPLFILDVMLPRNIADCLTTENHNAHFLDGSLVINYTNSASLTEPSPLGYPEHPTEFLSQCLKVRLENGKSGVQVCPLGEEWTVCVYLRS